MKEYKNPIEFSENSLGLGSHLALTSLLEGSKASFGMLEKIAV